MCDIQLKNVTFGYSCAEPALEDLSIDIARGEFVAVFGPNGAGKSTMIKLIAGLLEPQQGDVLVDGRRAHLARGRGLIGYVPQLSGRAAAGFPATVEEIAGLGLAAAPAAAKSATARRHIVSHLLELVGLSEVRGRRIGQLSGGQQQRAMVARALAGNPQILLLDEPTSGIDFAASTRIFSLLSELNRNLGITVVMVSHDISRATDFAGKVACVNHGLCFFGDSHEFRESHAFSGHLWFSAVR